MKQTGRWNILEHAQVANDAACSEHFSQFVSSFVKKEYRDRWLHLLLTRPKQIYKNSSKLEAHLDKSKCTAIDETSYPGGESLGLYYDFSNQPVMILTSSSLVVGENHDGIFSISPGKLAIYFSHEGHNWLCKL